MATNKSESKDEDAISRQAVIDAIKNYASMLWKKYYEPFPESTIMEIIQELPSVTPQPKTGYWIKESPFLMAECSECGNKAFGNHGFDEVLTEFCPKCGAKMAESE